MSVRVTASGDVCDFVAQMPKTELHLHLEGCLEPGMKLRLAQRNNLDLPLTTEPEIRASYGEHNDLPSFLAVHYSNVDVLRTANDFEELAFHYFTVAAAHNVRHAEVFFDPQLHTGRGIPFVDVITGIHRAIERAYRQYGMSSHLIMCFLRDRGAEAAHSTLTESLDFRDWILGVGLDSDERGHPPREFAQVFARARKEGLRLTMHCDVDQENSVEHIRQAMQDVRVDRIDHGLNVLEDPALVAAARDRGLGFTVCPLAYGTHVVGIVPELQRIAEMLDAGLLVSIGSDDPPYFGGYLNDNLQALLNHGYTRETVLQTQRNAVSTAWLDPARRRNLLDELDSFGATWGIS